MAGDKRGADQYGECSKSIAYQNKATAIRMTLEEKSAASETRIFKAVFPNTTNHYDTLFGGTAMALMDEVAFIRIQKDLNKTI